MKRKIHFLYPDITSLKRIRIKRTNLVRHGAERVIVVCWHTTLCGGMYTRILNIHNPLWSINTDIFSLNDDVSMQITTPQDGQGLHLVFFFFFISFCRQKVWCGTFWGGVRRPSNKLFFLGICFIKSPVI